MKANIKNIVVTTFTDHILSNKLLKETSIGFKADYKREMLNVVQDVEKEIHKTWKIDYKGHSREITNQIKEEQLII